MAETILFYTHDRNKAEKLKQICRSVRTSFRAMKEEEFSCTLASLATGKPLTPPGKTLPEDFAAPELLIFAGLSEGTLDAFLEKYKQKKLAPIPLKAVITPHNIFWTAYELCEELKKEHREMTGGK